MAKSNKKPHNRKNNIRLYVCPRCMKYHYSMSRNCDNCGCQKGLTSVLKKCPINVNEIPREDWNRIIAYRKTNGYSYSQYEKYYRVAKVLGVRIPRDDKPSYIMKGLRAPKAQRGGVTGLANHYGASGYVYNVSGGSCSSK